MMLCVHTAQIEAGHLQEGNTNMEEQYVSQKKDSDQPRQNEELLLKRGATSVWTEFGYEVSDMDQNQNTVQQTQNTTLLFYLSNSTKSLQSRATIVQLSADSIRQTGMLQEAFACGTPYGKKIMKAVGGNSCCYDIHKDLSGGWQQAVYRPFKPKSLICLLTLLKTCEKNGNYAVLNCDVWPF